MATSDSVYKQKMIFVIFLFLWGSVKCLPQGAPTKVCETMLPNHGGGIPPQTGTALFIVTTLRRQNDIIVTIKSPIEVPFQGFMLQARGTTGKLLGKFEPITPGAHTINCNGTADSLTHSNTDSKTAIDTHWFAPDNFEGTVIFKSTYEGMRNNASESRRRHPTPNWYSPIHQKQIPVTSPRFPPSIIFRKDEEVKDPFYDGCTEMKNCFGAPLGCIATQDCVAAVTVTVKGDRYIFDLKARNSARWVGVGLSTDTKMGNDSVIECVDEGNSISAYMSRTTSRPNLGVIRLNNPKEGIQLLRGDKLNDTIHCQVQRNAVTIVDGVKYDLVNNQYNLLVAAGTGVRDNSVGFHDLTAEPSSTPIYLAEVSEIVGASKLLYRLHGVFMVIAWIGAVSIGTILARYYRKTWVGRTLWGKDIWFSWHRNLMVITWALTVVAFILIFIELKAWSTESNPHAILGIFVTILCFVQPIGAYFRPHPGTAKRPIFNWLHWGGGNAAHILAIITIFFANSLTKAELPTWFDWIMVAYVVFHVAMHLILSIMQCVSDKAEQETNVNVFSMKEINGSRKMNSIVNQDAPYASSRKGLLAVYMTGVVGLVIVLVIVICISPIK
ncbi:putative ferric-chelate reductase 1 homolog [Agrilus planipennis]|uniref:Ferric-chelate reductase 1 homolog n=1 Tax=Agrilus planipennis TaxID=224129 RepID=A0A7F5RD53_AGRPL|nr:putative ferric-chelate reductase 1 homolog [Agrilus planipennis]